MEYELPKPIIEEIDIPLQLNDTQRNAFKLFNYHVFNGLISLEKVTKCICGNSSFSVLSNYDRFGLPFGTHICSSCALVGQSLRIATESMPLFYEKLYCIGNWLDKPEFMTPPKANEESLPARCLVLFQKK